ncbi:MAG TPA: Uma2 family endonuclease [Gemmatimonadales bacterium]|nr:Uma2 family endonuclease [Gemmatimonadales bacterium]
MRALPNDGRRYELVSGELVVTLAPRGVHQVMVTELFRRLDRWLHATAVGHLLISPADISLGEDEVLQPDLFVYRTTTGRPLRDWSDITGLLLAIEVTSPSTARYDRTLKRLRYQRAGVPEYWVVDPDARLVERWRPADERPEILVDRLAWQPPGAESGLELDLAGLFEEVTGES